jgi:hypothetical protein
MSEYKRVPYPQAGQAPDGSYYSGQMPQQGYAQAQAGMQYGAGAAVPSSPSSPSAAPASGLSSWVNVSNSDYLKGLALGAGVALVACNPAVRQAIISGAVKVWSAVQGGVEEVKEQIQDVKAELSYKE